MPLLILSEDELARLPKVENGDEVDCFVCGGEHTLYAFGTGDLLIMKCQGKLYLRAVQGRLLEGRYEWTVAEEMS